MAIVVDIAERLKAAFGFTAASQRGMSQPVEVYVSDHSFEEMTFRSPDNRAMTFAGMLDGVLNDIYAPPPMVSFSRGKNLVITEIDGSDAEVVERFGDKSWEVKIRGILVDMVNHQYPSNKVVLMRQFFEVGAQFAVEGQMFDDLAIKSIYFTNVEIAGVAGYEDTIQFSLDARSIKPVEFFLVNKPLT